MDTCCRGCLTLDTSQKDAWSERIERVCRGPRFVSVGPQARAPPVVEKQLGLSHLGLSSQESGPLNCRYSQPEWRQRLAARYKVARSKAKQYDSSIHTHTSLSAFVALARGPLGTRSLPASTGPCHEYTRA